MIFDTKYIFSDKQAITADAASTNVIDLGTNGVPHGGIEALKRDIGKGSKIPLTIQVTEDFAALTSLTISVQSSDDTGFGTFVTHGSTGSVDLADLKSGWQSGFDGIPHAGTGEMGRYLRLYYDVTGANATAGKITAAITAGTQTNG